MVVRLADDNFFINRFREMLREIDQPEFKAYERVPLVIGFFEFLQQHKDLLQRNIYRRLRQTIVDKLIVLQKNNPEFPAQRFMKDLGLSQGNDNT